MRTRVYVDGFNLYYGALKGTPFKWLDPVRLSALVLPSECVVDKVLHFTACVSGSTDREAPARQQVYLNALGTLPEVEVRFGSFLAKTVWRPLVNLPVADRRIDTPEPVVLPAGDHTVAGPSTQTLPVGSYPSTGAQEKRRRKATAPLPNSLIAEFHTLEEKGSDVNLAAHLLNDAWGDQFEVAAVISNDTDLVTPIRMVTRERSKTVYIVCPGRWRAAPKLTGGGQPRTPHPGCDAQESPSSPTPCRVRQCPNRRVGEPWRKLTRRAQALVPFLALGSVDTRPTPGGVMACGATLGASSATQKRMIQ